MIRVIQRGARHDAADRGDRTSPVPEWEGCDDNSLWLAGLCYIKGMTLARLCCHAVCNDLRFGRLFSPYVVAGDTLTVAWGVRMRAYVGREADRNSDDGRVLPPEGLRALGLCQAKRLVGARDRNAAHIV